MVSRINQNVSNFYQSELIGFFIFSVLDYNKQTVIKCNYSFKVFTVIHKHTVFIPGEGNR